MAFSEDLSVFFSPEGFGVTATLAGQAVVGILDAGFNHATLDGFGDAGTSPRFTLPSSQVPQHPEGLVLVVSNGAGQGSYRVANARPDGTGITVLDLLT